MRVPEGGFSLIEVTITLVVSVLMLYALHSTVRSSLDTRRSTRRAYEISRLAQDYLSRLQDLPFGKPTDPKPSGSQLSELFDDDEDYGTITLYQLVVPPDEEGHVFVVAADGLVGVWRIKVSTDLDADGDLDGPREGRPDLVRIDIYFQERLVLSTMRAAEPEQTTIDSGARY